MDVLVAVGGAVDAQEIHVCACGHRDTADRMFNPNRKFTEGKLIKLCRKCAREATRKGVFLYRLTCTLKMDAERKVRTFARDSIFAAIAKKQRESEKRVNGESRPMINDA